MAEPLSSSRTSASGLPKRERATGPGRAVVGPEHIARRFHDVYEELAPVYGWQTQERSRVPWEDVPSENKRLMVKVVTRLLHDGTIVGGTR